jgi:hypothetical protein
MGVCAMQRVKRQARQYNLNCRVMASGGWRQVKSEGVSKCESTDVNKSNSKQKTVRKKTNAKKLK